MDNVDKMDRDQGDMEQERKRPDDLQQERKSRGEARERHLDAGRVLAGRRINGDVAREGLEGQEGEKG